MAKNALKWIISEAKTLRRKYPKRFKTWRQFVKQAAAIYARKQAGGSHGKKTHTRTTRIKTKTHRRRIGNYVGRHRLNGSADQPFLRHGAGNKILSGIENRSLKTLHLLVNELNSAQKNLAIYKAGKKSIIPSQYKKLMSRYPQYIRSLKKQITEAKKNIK